MLDQPNVGLGALDDVTEDQEEEVHGFYSRLGEVAKEANTIISGSAGPWRLGPTRGGGSRR